MAACPAASSSSRNRLWPLALAGLLAYLVAFGGRMALYVVEPELSWISLLLICSAGGLALVSARLPRALAGLLGGIILLSLVSTACCAYPRAGWEASLWLTAWVSFCALGYQAVRRGGPDGQGVAVLWPGVALVAVIGVLQALGRLPIEPAYMTEHGRTRVLATLNHPNNLASYIALVLPIVLALLVDAIVRRRWLPLAINMAMAAALLWTAAATYSRGGQLGVIAGLLAVVVGSALALGTRRRFLAGVLIALVVLGGTGLASPLGHRFRLALSAVGQLGGDERAGTWRAATSMVRAHPLLGVGPGGFYSSFAAAKNASNHIELFTHAHNWYLHVAAEGGLPALAALLLLLGGALYRCAATLRRSSSPTERLVAAGLGAGVLGYAVAGLLDVGTGVPAIALTVWLVIGMAWACWPADADEGRLVRLPGRLAAALLVGLFGVWTAWTAGHVHYQRALAAWCGGAWSVGAAELERARALDPGQRAYQLARVDLADLAGRRDLAEEMLARMDRAGQLVDSPYRQRLASLRAGHGDLAGANLVLQRTAEVTDRAQPVVWEEIGWLNLDRDAKLARSAFDTALARRPDQMGAMMGRAALALAEGDGATARALVAAAEQVPLAKDRLPRLLVGYGRLDPLLVVPASLRGHFVRDRFSWHGAMVPALTATLYGEWLDCLP